jgi:hypothetical protein
MGQVVLGRFVRFNFCSFIPNNHRQTILSAIVIDDLNQSLPSGTPVLCIYFEQRRSSPHTPNNLLGSLLRQLIRLEIVACQRELKMLIRKLQESMPE